VNLNLFPPTPKPEGTRPTLLFVGSWCYRKGCDLLSTALERLRGTHLIHVGAVGDCPLPRSERFQHVDSVPEWRLPEYYAQAHVLALPSREDGFGLVLSQGLACGLTLVASRATGGRDLLEMTDDREKVRLVPPGDLEALVLELRGALDRALQGPAERTLPEKTRERLSWGRFAEVYRAELSRAFHDKNLMKAQA